MKKKYSQEKYWRIVDRIIKESNVLLEILDARFPYQTKNSVLEGRIKNAGKPLIRIITKADLVAKQKLDKAVKKLSAIPFSAKTHLNTKKIIQEIMKHYQKQKKIFYLKKSKSPTKSRSQENFSSLHPNKGEKFLHKKEKSDKPFYLKVGVIGYPNIGKSSLINSLKGKKSAPTSPIAGFTKGKQWIKITNKILLIDTPGVIPFKEKNQLKLILKSAITQVKDSEQTAIDLIEMIPKQKLENFYKIKYSKDSEKTLERIALKKNLLKKGNIPDLKRAGQLLISDIQKNKLRLY